MNRLIFKDNVYFCEVNYLIVKMEMKNNMTKREYTKPSVKLVEWNFSEAVCQTMGNGSKVNSFVITSNKSYGLTDIRSGNSEGWSRVNRVNN